MLAGSWAIKADRQSTHSGVNLEARKYFFTCSVIPFDMMVKMKNVLRVPLNCGQIYLQRLFSCPDPSALLAISRLRACTTKFVEPLSRLNV